MYYVIKSLATQKYLSVENLWSFAPSWSKEIEQAKHYDSFEDADVVRRLYSNGDVPVVLAFESP